MVVYVTNSGKYYLSSNNFFLFGFSGQGLTRYLWLFWPWIYRNLPASAIWVFGLKVYTSTPSYENILKKIHRWWRVSGSEKFRQVQRPRILKASVLGPGDTGMSKTSTLLWLQEVPALVTLLWYSVWYSSWHGVSLWVTKPGPQGSNCEHALKPSRVLSPWNEIFFSAKWQEPSVFPLKCGLASSTETFLHYNCETLA